MPFLKFHSFLQWFILYVYCNRVHKIMKLLKILVCFFLSGFSFTNIHDSRDSRGRGGYLFNSSLPLPPATQTLAGRLLQKAHLCTAMGIGGGVRQCRRKCRTMLVLRGQKSAVVKVFTYAVFLFWFYSVVDNSWKI